MKKKFLLLTILMIVSAFSYNLYAQEDVTSKYITNASLSSLSGWTAVNFNTPVSGNGTIRIENEDRKSYNTVGYATECYAGWSRLEITNYSLTQTIKLPAGNYTLVNYSFFRYGIAADTDAGKSQAFLKAGNDQVAIKTLGSIQADGYANSQLEGAVAFDSKMYRNTLDFTIPESDTEIEIGLVGTFDLKQSWCIVGKFELIYNDKEATMVAPFDVTGYITNSGFEYRNMNGWTQSLEGYFQTQINDQGFKTGLIYAEKWQSKDKGKLPEGSMSQTISNLPAGYYKLSVNLGGDGTYVDLNGKIANWTEDKDYTVGYVLAENEDLTITAGKTTEGSANWIHFDNFKLYFCGDVAKALTDLIAKKTDYESKLPAAAYAQLVSDVNEYDQNYTDVDELLAAIDAVTALYTDADALATAYAAYLTALERANTAVATTDKIYEQLRDDLSSVIEANNPVAEQTVEAYDNATDALNEAAAAVENSANSYKIIAAGEVPTNSIDGWVTENSNVLQVNTWSTEADGTGMVTPFIENWVYKNNVLGDGKVYYTLSGLKPGEIYYAQALVRAYSEAGNVPNGPNFFINDVVTDMTSEGTSFTFNNMKGYYGTLGGTAVVGEDGTIKLGVVISGANYNWVAFKNVAIQSMDDALQAAIDKVEAYYDKIPAGVKSATQSLVSSLSSPTTPAEYEAAIQTLTEKAEELAAIVLSYEKYLELKAYGNSLAGVESDNPTGMTELSDFIEEVDEDVQSATTQDAIDAAYDSLKDKMVEYANASNPTDGNRFDLTFMLTNPNLEGLPIGQSCDGWASEETDGNSQVMTNDSKTNGTKTAFYEYWSNPAKASGKFALYLTVNLTPGIYNMSCYAFAEDQYTNNTVNGVWFYADETQGSAITSTKLEPANIEFVNTEEHNVKIGLKTTTGNTRNWMGIGYVELYKLPSTKVTELTDADTEAPAAGAYTSITYDRSLLEGLNTLVLPFQTTKEELGENVEAVLEYTGTTTSGDKITLNFSPVETLSPNVPYAIMMTADAPLPEFENKTLIEPTDLTVTDANGMFDFVGTYTCWTKNVDSPIVNGDYVAGATEFKKAKGGNGLKAYRAYLKKAETVDPTNVAFNFDGYVVEGIEAVELLDRMSGEYYNLNGQRVGTPQRGIYIKDGKKIIVK